MRGLRLIVTVAGAAAVLGLAGCGDDPAATVGSTSDAKKAEQYTTTEAPPETDGGLATDSDTSTTADDESPAAGTDLAAAPDGVAVISNGSGFTIVKTPTAPSGEYDESTATAYTASGRELATLPMGAFTLDCGIADVRIGDSQRLIVTALVSTSPAEGIKPEETSTKLTAWDATTGDEVWTIPVNGDAGCEQEEGNMVGFATTYDGKWGIYGGSYPFERTKVIDMRTGKATVSTRHLQVLGNYLVERGTGDRPVSSVVDPATSKVASRLRGIEFYGEPNAAPTGLLESNSASSFAPAGLTDDGQRLVATVDDERLVAYTLPGAAATWRAPKSFDPDIIGDAGGILLASDEPADGPTKVVGLDDRTGEEKWRVPGGEVCGMTGSQFLLGVNGQLAVIDTQTGEQVSYTADGSTCPTLLAGGIGVTRNSSGATVTQALEP